MGVERIAAARSTSRKDAEVTVCAAASPHACPFHPKRAICDSAWTRVYAQAVARPPVVCNHGRRLVWHWHWHWATGTKADAILSPPPPVSLFPQSLSLFPSLRQLSRTCTTQLEPCSSRCLSLPFLASYPRPSSNKLSQLCPNCIRRPLLHRAAAFCSLLVRTARAVVVRGLPPRSRRTPAIFPLPLPPRSRQAPR